MYVKRCFIVYDKASSGDPDWTCWKRVTLWYIRFQFTTYYATKIALVINSWWVLADVRVRVTSVTQANRVRTVWWRYRVTSVSNERLAGPTIWKKILHVPVCSPILSSQDFTADENFCWRRNFNRYRYFRAHCLDLEHAYIRDIGIRGSSFLSSFVLSSSNLYIFLTCFYLPWHVAHSVFPPLQHAL